MPKILPIVAMLIDFALAALMIGVSGFLFGSGPESMRGGGLLLTAYMLGVIACVVLPIAGFIVNSRGRAGLALLLAWLPPLGVLLAVIIPAPY